MIRLLNTIGKQCTCFNLCNNWENVKSNSNTFNAWHNRDNQFTQQNDRHQLQGMQWVTALDPPSFPPLLLPYPLPLLPRWPRLTPIQTLHVLGTPSPNPPEEICRAPLTHFYRGPPLTPHLYSAAAVVLWHSFSTCQKKLPTLLRWSNTNSSASQHAGGTGWEMGERELWIRLRHCPTGVRLVTHQASPRPNPTHHTEYNTRTPQLPMHNTDLVVLIVVSTATLNKLSSWSSTKI